MKKTALARQAKATSTVPSAQGVLQRQCACGNLTMVGGDCRECSKKKSGLQRELTVGASNDPSEQEADRIAEQVMRMPEVEVGRQRRDTETPLVQRRATGRGTGAAEAPSIVHDVVHSPGRPLDSATHAFFEPRFGHDFGHVRVHAGAMAEQSARDVNAQAYTVGHDIVFGGGRFSPESREGQRLLAHEPAHVVQQSTLAHSRKVQRQAGGGVLPGGAAGKGARHGIGSNETREPCIRMAGDGGSEKQ